MSAIHLNMLLAYTISLLGLTIYRTHLMSSLLCLEGMMLALFTILATTSLDQHYILISSIPIIMLVFAACEAAVGLSLLITISNTYGTDHVQNLNLLQC